MLGAVPLMSVRTFLCITLLYLCHSLCALSALTNEVPQQTAASGATPAPPSEQLPDSPPVLDADGQPIPIAQPVAAPPSGTPVHVEAAQQQINGHTYTLIGEVTIHYRDYILRADKVSYNQDTGDIEADGHLQVEGGPEDEMIQADHGSVNVDVDSARFYDVIGTVGVRMNATRRKVVYTGVNPFIFTGRVVIQEGRAKFKIIDGTMTSCRLPHPDWRITAGEIFVGDGKAYAKSAAFRLLSVPILYLPYVTHPVGSSDRQSGFLIPVYSNSNIKGTVLGEQAFFVLNRSMDLTVGVDYYSKRGWAPSGEYRYRGRDGNYADMRFSALADRLGEGGSDIILNGWRSLDAQTRAVSNLEYLSSYAYRNVFANSFAQAVASQVDSSAFVTRNELSGASESLNYSRYTSYQSTTAGEDILISHEPELEYDTIDRKLQHTPFTWAVEAAAGGLSRREPGEPGEAKFQTASEVGRVDLHPTLALPLHFDGWGVRSAIALRDTFYSASQSPGLDIPTYRSGSADRKDFEASINVRPPAMERDFDAPWLTKLLGGEVRHVIQPEIEYDYVTGVSNFGSILRFDDRDVVSDTNQIRYTLGQRFYFKRAASAPCTNPPVPLPASGRIYLPLEYHECAGGDSSKAGKDSHADSHTDSWISWDLSAAHFFNQGFGGAVLPFRRNVLTSTLDLTGISFLYGAREDSPIISRLAVHTSQRVQFGWDADYDTRAGRMNNSNLYASFRVHDFFGSVSEDRLRQLTTQSTAFLSQSPATLAQLAAEAAKYTPVTPYNQVQLVIGYGYDTKPGFSAGLNSGFDYQNSQLQYGGAQTTYNWDCCGLTIEYRRLALGSLRNENYESFNFTLAGVGTAGNTNRSTLVY